MRESAGDYTTRPAAAAFGGATSEWAAVRAGRAPYSSFTAPYSPFPASLPAPHSPVQALAAPGSPIRPLQPLCKPYRCVTFTLTGRLTLTLTLAYTGA